MGYSKHLITELRALLRFLHLEGLAQPLVDAVPAVAGWRESLLPRGLTLEQMSPRCWTAATPARRLVAAIGRS